MSNIVLKVENLSKQYRLGLVGTGTLSHDLNRWWYKVRGKENPYLKIGEANDRASKGKSEYVWALKDINFELKQGEVLGIIGKNGAGKSTLLKILSKVTGPSSGLIKSKGRIASLLEVGTGFHPELTGKENVFLNGTLLGMTKPEIKRKLEEIIDFAGVERYIDTPVKRYSSGMRVRLGFAVAAFLEPEILVVDEVLAVGDADFQKKAIGKMQNISIGEGRTVLFVSHNMASVKELCEKGIVLKNGNIALLGNVDEAINFYLASNQINTFENSFYLETIKGRVTVLMINEKKEKALNFKIGESITFKFIFEDYTKIPKANIGIGINNNFGVRIVTYHTSFQMSSNLEIGNNDTVVCEVDSLNLMPDTYQVEISLFSNSNFTYYNNPCICKIQVEGTNYFNTGKLPQKYHGIIVQKSKWSKYEY